MSTFPENLIPNPPADVPEAPGVGDATAPLIGASEAQDVDSIIAGLTLNRELPLSIPNRQNYKDRSFHFINDNADELAAAMRQHWRPVTDPALLAITSGKVSGTDKTGKISKLMLMERDIRITQAYDKLKRQRLAELNAGMDPRTKQFNSKYADTQSVINAGETAGKFSGTGMGRIKV
jgi:hypothetical protein